MNNTNHQTQAENAPAREIAPKIKAKYSKAILRLRAIAHYLQSNSLFQFMSLYDDKEPYPLKEVIYFQQQHIQTLKEQMARCPCDFYQAQITKAENQLRKLQRQNERLKGNEK